MTLAIALTVALLIPRSVSGDNVDSVQVGITGATLPGKPREGTLSHRQGIAGHHHQHHQNAKAAMLHDNSKHAKQASGDVDPTQTTSQSAMQCNDPEEGFLALGGVITGLLKSCPQELPINKPQEFCSSNKCQIDPDRATCCRTKECKCPNGVETKGDDCETDGEQDCESCSDGSTMSAPAGTGAQTCKERKCDCLHGTATSGADCATDGAQDCSACEDGYTLTGEAGSQSCKANICKCQKGTPSSADGDGTSKCMTDGDVDCGACDPGYQPDTPPSDDTKTTCEPVPCNTDKLPTGTGVDTSKCAGTTTDATCSVTCKPGYTGESEAYKCGTDKAFTGNAMICTPDLCNKNAAPNCFGDNTVSASCDDKKTGDTCKVTCSQGYGSNSATYSCTAAGWTCSAPVDCPPNPCTVDLNIENGNKGDCTSSLQDSNTCEIECNAPEYKVSGTMFCTAGNLTRAKCVEASCVGSTVLKDGYQDKGNCADPLASGESCNPTCAAGHTLSGATQCSLGQLTPAVCESDLKCTLEYGKDLGSMDKGYWTEEENYLDYAGCERFCTDKNANGPEKVTGCELVSVSASNRATKGKFCFAHIQPWGSLVLGEKADIAACKVPIDPNALPTTCKCVTPNAGTAGNNEYECNDGTSGFCPANKECYATGAFEKGNFPCKVP